MPQEPVATARRALGLLDLTELGDHATEDDVTAAARAWTGHGIDWDTLAYHFYPTRHDIGTKTFMGVTRNWDGPAIIDFLLTEKERSGRMVTDGRVEEVVPEDEEEEGVEEEGQQQQQQ